MTAGLDPITELIAKAIVNVTAWQRRSLAHAHTGGCGARSDAFGPIGRAVRTQQRNQSFIVRAANSVCTGHDAQGLRWPGLRLWARRPGRTWRTLCAGRARGPLRTLCTGRTRWALWTLCPAGSRGALWTLFAARTGWTLWTLCAGRTRWALWTLFAARARWTLRTRCGLAACRDSERHDEDRNTQQLAHRQALRRRCQFGLGT